MRFVLALRFRLIRGSRVLCQSRRSLFFSLNSRDISIGRVFPSFFHLGVYAHDSIVV